MVSRFGGLSVRKIEEGLRPKVHLGATPSGYVENLPAEVIAKRLTGMAVFPGALQVECERHSPPVDVPCFGRAGQRGRGICGDRLAGRAMGPTS